MIEHYCTNCNASLNSQRGFNPGKRHWHCRECGELLINPGFNEGRTTRFNDVEWFCDNCNDCLSEQEGFSDWCDYWNCSKCGYENHIALEEIVNYPGNDNSKKMRQPKKRKGVRISLKTVKKDGKDNQEHRSIGDLLAEELFPKLPRKGQ